MAGQIAIFICGCLGAVADIVDPARVLEGLAKVKKNVVVKAVHSHLCSPEGRDLIVSAVGESGADRLLIAACPDHVHAETFREAAKKAGIPGEMILRADIRDGCARMHRDNPAAALVKAINLIKMYNARAKLLKPYRPVTAEAPKEALVIGAGMAGLTCAYELVQAGVNVTVVEKEWRPGGRVAQLNKIFPRRCDSGCGLTFLLNRLEESNRFTMYTGTELTSLSGSAGRLEAVLTGKPRYVVAERCTGCGKCAAACPVEVPDESGFGLGKRKAAVPPLPFDPVPAYFIDRSACLEDCRRCVRACPTGAIQLTAGPSVRKVKCSAVIVSTGWRPYEVERVERLGYGRVPNVITGMQMERLTAAGGPARGLVVRPGDGKPVKKAAFIQCAGSRDVNHQRWCSAVCCTAALKQALLLKEAVPEAEIYIFYTDIRTPGEYEELYLEAQQRGVVFVRSSPAEIRASPEGNPVVLGEDTLLGKRYQVEVDLAVLAAGIKPNEIPPAVADLLGTGQLAGYGLLSESGFFPGHRQCFPYESRHGSIFFAGTVQEPLDIAGTVRSAAGAAGKVVRLLADKVEVPPQVPFIDRPGCDKCKRCVEECPYGVMRLDEEGYPVPELAFCRACLLCMGACPRNCISTQGFSTGQMAAMVTAKVKDVLPGEPFVVAFMCENDAYRALLDTDGEAVPPNIHVIPVRCLGSVNMLVVQDAVPRGVDGFIFAGCRSGECHYLRGSDRAAERIENLAATFREMMFEPDRIAFIRAGLSDGKELVAALKDFVGRLKAMGPSPFKNGRVNAT
ncbi:MAG: FAD-dependent oxidoreductase [Firmicutes bacterium]|nr:FAD-dependent oxidoreductase [Bacillota bacterium]